MSSVSCFLQFCWSFLYNQLFFSSLEATWTTYFECITLLSFCRCVASHGRLSYLILCWHTLEKALPSLSNSHTMQLHGSFQALRQGDSSVSIYMQQAKSLFDELAAVNHPMSFEDFNIYVFHDEFKDLVTSLITKTKSLSYVDLHSNLLTHEFLRKNSVQSMDTTASLLPSSLLP